MPAEEREPMPGASRRRLLVAALAIPAAGAMAHAAKGMPADDGPAFLHAEDRYDHFSRLGSEASERVSAEGGRGCDADAAAAVLWDQGNPFDDFLTDTPCTTRLSAAVKLRHMIKTSTLHATIGDEPEDAELKMLRQVLAFLEGA